MVTIVWGTDLIVELTRRSLLGKQQGGYGRVPALHSDVIVCFICTLTMENSTTAKHGQIPSPVSTVAYA